MPLAKRIAMNAAEFLQTVEGSAIEENLKFVKNNSELNAIVLESKNGTQYAVSKQHIQEMGDGIQITTNKGVTYFVAKWRKAGQNSFWLRADEGSARAKLTLADILG